MSYVHFLKNLQTTYWELLLARHSFRYWNVIIKNKQAYDILVIKFNEDTTKWINKYIL